MNTNNSVKWRIFKVPKKLNKFTDTYKSNNIKIGVNYMKLYSPEMVD